LGFHDSHRASSGLELPLGASHSARRRPLRGWRIAAFIVLLLLLAALVGGLLAFLSFRRDVGASNRRVPAAAKRALAPSSDVLSEPQTILIVFDRASLFARVDPEHRLISLLSIPGSAYIGGSGATTVGDALGAGTAEFVRFARTVLHLQVAHVALLRAHDIGPLVDAVGGVEIEDVSTAGGGRETGRIFLDGAAAGRYVAEAGGLFGARRERERAVLEGVIARLASVASLSRLPRLARTFSSTVATDLSPRETLELALVRLRSRLSIQCGLPERAALGQQPSRRVIRQFEGTNPTPRERGRIFPSSGCRTTALSVRAPAAVVFFGKEALALFPFVPELAAGAIALDLILLLALVGAPQALVGILRHGQIRGWSRPGEQIPPAEPKEPLPSASLSDALADRATSYAAPPEPRTSPAEATGAYSEFDVALQRLADDVDVSASKATYEEGQGRPGGDVAGATMEASRPTRYRDRAPETVRSSETLREAVTRWLPHGGLRAHADAALFVVGTAAGVGLGYLISQL
jgi:anionic cell wall polymer biosynthesis LytR-Cps2A-Psr (LCP) family protein